MQVLPAEDQLRGLFNEHGVSPGSPHVEQFVLFHQDTMAKVNLEIDRNALQEMQPAIGPDLIDLSETCADVCRTMPLFSDAGHARQLFTQHLGGILFKANHRNSPRALTTRLQLLNVKNTSS